MSTNYFFRAISWRTSEHTFFKPILRVETAIRGFNNWLARPVTIDML